ncbi:MAG: hypothetical protein ABI442_07745 [Gemmatimonadaceae bacterium]
MSVPVGAALCVAAVCALVSTSFARPLASPPPADLAAFLDKSIGLNAKQTAAVGAGQLVTKILQTSIDRDVVVFGIIAVDVPRPWFINHFKEVDVPPRSPGRTSFGTFGKPALASDVGQLILSADDAKDIGACRPASCTFKLPASSMAFLNSRVTWGSPNAVSELAAGAREQMAGYVNDYRQHGNDAMVVYDDNEASVKSSDALTALLADAPSPFPNVPEFLRYIQNPFEALDSVTSTVFWSQDQMPRTRPIASIHELSFYSPAGQPGASLIAVKQLWADHYLEANVDFITVLDRPATAARDASGVYLIMLREYRFDNLPNYRLFSIRNRVADGLRDQTDADLKRIKQAYEESIRAPKVSP